MPRYASERSAPYKFAPFEVRLREDRRAEAIAVSGFVRVIPPRAGERAAKKTAPAWGTS